MFRLARTVIEAVVFDEDIGAVVVSVRPRKGASRRCGRCGRRGPWFDRGEGRRRWRALDLGTVPVWLEADAPRVSCREHGPTVLQVPWTRLPDWPLGAEQLHAAGFHIAALALSDTAVELDDFAAAAPERVALILGTEGDGLSPDALSAADTVVTIPMLHGVDSLNVAAASAVALYALRRR